MVAKSSWRGSLQGMILHQQQADAAPILLQNGVHLEVRCAQRPAEHCPQVLLVLAGAAPLDGVVPCATHRAQGPRSDSGPELEPGTAASKCSERAAVAPHISRASCAIAFQVAPMALSAQLTRARARAGLSRKHSNCP